MRALILRNTRYRSSLPQIYEVQLRGPSDPGTRTFDPWEKHPRRRSGWKPDIPESDAGRSVPRVQCRHQHVSQSLPMPQAGLPL